MKGKSFSRCYITIFAEICSSIRRNVFFIFGPYYPLQTASLGSGLTDMPCLVHQQQRCYHRLKYIHMTLSNLDRKLN